MPTQASQEVKRSYDASQFDAARYLVEDVANKIRFGSVTVDPGAIGAGALGTVDVTITGLASGDFVLCVPPATIEAGLVPVSVAYQAANTARITILNTTAAPIDGASLSWSYLWISTKKPTVI